MTHKNYVGYAVVVITSFIGVLVLPVDDWTKDLLTLPGVAALLTFIFQLWRDGLAHERTKEIQSREQDFMLGTASHMAEVAYDKHVAFCEEYVGKVQDIFQQLLRDGTTKKDGEYGASLVRIRLKYSAWLTNDIENKLKPFETALIQMGSKNFMLQHLPVGPERTRVVEELYRFFEVVLGSEQPTSEEEAGMARDAVVARIRDILGITILTDLRIKATEIASARMK